MSNILICILYTYINGTDLSRYTTLQSTEGLLGQQLWPIGFKIEVKKLRTTKVIFFISYYLLTNKDTP